MIGLLQRVKSASVTVDGQVIGSAGQGLLVLVCAEKGDTEEQSEKLAKKVLAYRIFEDENGKMNRRGYFDCVSIYVGSRNFQRTSSELYPCRRSRNRQKALRAFCLQS